MQKINPYEYYNDLLGVKIKYLVSNRDNAPESLRLISRRALNARINSKTRCEKRLRRPALGFDALIEFNSLSQEWRDRITARFGAPIEQIKQSWFSKHYILTMLLFLILF